ncbi:MAG: flagellar hook-length control protein FliK [Alphaproteobacteria bacterium]|nr:flagellar hook-length control protein FliK [Alphaproteobacteria bacterium]
MKVAQVNSSLAPTPGQSQAEEPSSHADAFARVLQTAVYGRGSEAVAKTTERAMSAAAPRTETRPVERRDRAEPVATRPNTTPAPRKDAARETDTRDTAATQKPNESKTPARTETKPAKDTAAEKPAAEPSEKTTEETATAAPQQDAAQPVEQTAKDLGEQKAAGDSAEEILEDAGKPVVADAPDAALILALLQTQMPADAAAVTVVAPVAEAVVTTVAPATPVVAPVLSPEEAAAAALAAAAAAEAQAKTAAAPVQTDAAPADAETAVPVLPQPALPAGAVDPQIKTATETSAAALLSQQQTVSAEDFATIQQALVAQNQGQAQVQEQAGKPAVTAEAKQKAEPKADKIITVDVQTVTATPKALVDQAALFVMQDDDQAAADMAQLQQQTQAALQQQSQPTAQDLKFNAALLQAAADDIALQGGNTASSNNGQTLQQSAAVGATTTTQAAQATHQAATQTAARHLNAYVPVGEQVGVQIKKGVAEGIDKISIRLDPGNLGKVEIKLEIGHDGRLQAVIAADKPETLQLLQQDVKNLEQSLRDAGLKTDQQSLNFTLRDQGQANEGRNGNGAGNGRYQNRGGDEYAETGANTDPAQLAAANAQRAAAARGGLDLRI